MLKVPRISIQGSGRSYPSRQFLATVPCT